MKPPLVSIIIPACHEEQTIVSVLRGIEDHVKTLHEVIIVVDKDDTDNTGDIAQRFAKTHKDITVLIRRKNVHSGFARALADGFAKAKGEFVIPVMADGCDDLATIDRMVSIARNGWDIVVGSRYVGGGKKSGGPLIQSILSKLTCVGIRLLTGVPTTDVSNSFKLYRRPLLRRLHIDPTAGTEVSMDLTLQAYFSGATITEIPTIWRGSKSEASELAIFRRTPRYSKVFLYALSKSFERRPLPFVVFALSIAVILAYWQTTRLYFWGDDWDLFFKVLNPQDPNLWHLGPGIFGQGSYRYLHTPFVFLYPLFGLNAGAYWAVGMALYVIAACSVYLLVRTLVGKPGFALAIALLFSVSGYIGSYTTFHLSNLYQMLFAVIFICWTLWMLRRHYQTGSFLYYAGSILLFWATIEFVFLRTSGILFLVIGLGFLFGENDRGLISRMVKLLPFILIFIAMYTLTPVSGQGGEGTVRAFLQTIRTNHRLGYLWYPFGTLGNIIIPDGSIQGFYALLSETLPHVWIGRMVWSAGMLLTLLIAGKLRFGRLMLGAIVAVNVMFLFLLEQSAKIPILILLHMWTYSSVFVGWFVLENCFLVFSRATKGQRNIAILGVFGVVWFFAQYVGYLLAAPRDSLLGTYHRYLTPTIPGVALMLGSFLFLFFQNRRIFSLSIVGIVSYLIFMIHVETGITIRTISDPTREFYRAVKREIITLPEGSIVFFDLIPDPQLSYRFRSSYPSSALAILYGLKSQIDVVDSWEGLQREFILKKNINTVFSFHVTEASVVNTTAEVRQKLENL